MQLPPKHQITWFPSYLWAITSVVTVHHDNVNNSKVFFDPGTGKKNVSSVDYKFH